MLVFPKPIVYSVQWGVGAPYVLGGDVRIGPPKFDLAQSAWPPDFVLSAVGAGAPDFVLSAAGVGAPSLYLAQPGLGPQFCT